MKKRILAIVAAVCMVVSLASCGSPASVKISIGGEEIELLGTFEESVKAFREAGYVTYSILHRMQVMDDGVSVEAVDKLEPGKVVLTSKNLYNPYNEDTKDLTGYYEYSFDHTYGGEFSFVVDGKSISTYDEALDAGFFDTQKYAVRMYADGKAVDFSKYEDIAEKYVVNFVTGECRDAEFLMKKGYIDDESEYHAFFSGYGLVREIGWENFTMTLTMLRSEQEGIKIANESFVKDNPNILNLAMVVLAASEQGRKYAKGDIDNYSVILIPSNPDDEYFVNVACDGTEAGEWYVNPFAAIFESLK